MAKILIVEDEAIVAMEYKISLVKHGHTVTAIASSYNSALLAFNANTPDLMLVDIKLKGEKDGIEVALEIRQYSNIPIIFLTGNTELITVERLKHIDNSFFFSKPILTNILLLEINRSLSKK